MNGQADIKSEVVLKISTQSKQFLIEAHEYNRLIWPHILYYFPWAMIFCLALLMSVYLCGLHWEDMWIDII